MPISKPNSGESHDDFIGRCMSEMKGEYTDSDQCLAICESSWKGKDEKSAQPQRAYTTFVMKKVDEEQRTIEGFASTPMSDRMEDVVDPMGARFKLPIPLIWQHESKEPVGEVIWAKPGKEGIPIKARFVKVNEPGKLKDRLDEAWQSVKHGLVRGLSVGFIPVEYQPIKGSRGIFYKAWDWMELSLVTIPANVEASIQIVKSIDQAARQAVSGQSSSRSEVVKLGKFSSGVPETTLKDISMKTMKEQMAAFEAKRAAAVGRTEEIMKKAADEARTLESAESEEHDNLLGEIASIDKHLKRLKDHEELLVSKATVIDPTKVVDPKKAGEARGGSISVRSNVEKGTAFARYALAIARSRGNIMQAVEISKQWHDSTPEVELALKTAVDAGTSITSGWAAELVAVQNMAAEFIELLRPQTIIGRIPGFRRVPFNVKMPRQLTGSSAAWVGQGKPKPVSELSFDTVSLGFAKCAGIVVLTEELVRLSNPSAEAVVRQDLLNTISQFQDEQFIDPSITLVANVSPASITNGVSAVTSTGGSVAQVTADVETLFAKFITARISLGTGVWIMHPRSALHLSLLRTTQEILAFPTITMQGGVFFGLPVVVSENVPVDANTAAQTIIVLANAGDIFLADDGAVAIDASREASVQLSDNPGTGASSLVSFWQNNLVGLRAERGINWTKRRAAAVQVLDNVAY